VEKLLGTPRDSAMRIKPDKMSARIGWIGLALLFLGFTSILALLFVALVVLPETQFSRALKAWTTEHRGFDSK